MEKLIKIFLLISLFVFVKPIFILADETNQTLTFKRNDQIIELNPDLTKAVMEDILNVIQYTSYDSTRENGNKKTWDKWMKAPTQFYIQFAAPTKITAYYKNELEATEILIPCEGKMCGILIRNNDQFWSYTKYLPKYFYNLICRPELELKPTDAFCEQMENMNTSYLESNLLDRQYNN